MQNIKRERCINWEKEEKQLMRNILRPYLSIIENKDLSTNTNKEKMRAWTEITEKFNVSNLRPRDKKQLMNQWKCLKLNSKKELSAFRRESSKTGGGPKPPSPSPDTLEVADMIPQEFDVDFNEFDCDGIKDMPSEIIIETINIVEPKISNNIFDDKDIQIEEIRDEKDNEIEHPATTPKRPTKKTPKSSKDNFNFGEASYTDMHSFRVLENERLQKEHELRMKNMAEIHNQVMINLRLQSEILAKTLNKTE